MPTDTTHEKRQIRELIDRLAPSQIAAVRGLLEAMVDPVAHSIANAPVGDEPLSAEEDRALQEAREWIKHNEGIPHEQVLAELGIAQAEIDNYRDPT